MAPAAARLCRCAAPRRWRSPTQSGGGCSSKNSESTKTLERDIDDLRAIHVLAMHDAQAVGCGRMVESAAGAKIGRMAVLPECRGRGTGRLVLDYLVAAARERAPARTYLHAQVPVEGFYLKYGFGPVGEVFEEAGIPHRRMELAL